ncbi:MAG: excinuclease ABC subunit UvrA [Gemmatimonadota bacterium]
MKDAIQIRGARQHNLKGIDLEIPRRSLTVLTGPSGSGKSSLAFDTVYAEGQRRYIESLSTYAKQFLERMEKPAVDRVEGVSPSVAIDQRNRVKTSRSTVGTVTEVYDYLRLLWARVGRTRCPGCRAEVVPDTVHSAAAEILAWASGQRLYVAFPLHLSAGIGHELAAANLRAQGYLRVLADGTEWHLAESEAEPSSGAAVPDLAAARELLVVVDRLRVDPKARERLVDSLAAAFAEGDGQAVALRGSSEGLEDWRARERRTFSEAFRCGCGQEFAEPRPSLFSFNSPAGACPACTGFGATLEYDPDLIVPDPSLSLAGGAIDPWAKPRYREQRSRLASWTRRKGVDPRTPWRELPESARQELLHGGAGFQGVLPFLRSKERKRYKRYIRVFLRQYQTPRRCASCGGARLRPEALNVEVGGLSIAAAAALPIDELRGRLNGLELPPFARKISASVLEELADRLGFLAEVGLGYLTLDRPARTLAGGEMQRIRLASCLGSHLADTLYVLDEPTIGLHPRDVERFLDVLCRLRDRGNTVLVVEHEPRVLRRADLIVELGPGAGERGGEVVFRGSWEALCEADTATGRALARRGRRPVRIGSRQRRLALGAGAGGPAGGWLRLRGAELHNVRGLDVEIPLGCLTVVTGVSGAGKSTLVHDILYRALERRLHGRSSAKEHLGETTGTLSALEGSSSLDAVVLVDQSPIGRTPRSNPVTYIKAFGEIRRIFAKQPLARRRNYGPGHFSFNVRGGRCEACKGVGVEQVEMVFLADVAVPCDACRGARYRAGVLEVEYRGRNIRQVLELTADQAIRFFLREDRLGGILWQLQRVGLGYLRLGQPATTLSGGEAQRLKVARELAVRPGSGRRLYILDEPTVGLGLGEIETLVSVLRELVGEGHTVLLVEHNLDVIARADWVIDLGPEAAAGGGRLVVAGEPERVARARASHTGRYLRRHLAAADSAGEARAG